jgi:hypothetical protein
LLLVLNCERRQRNSFSEVIIGISRGIKALIKEAVVLSLFPAIKYSNMKAGIISDCYRYELNFL